VSTSKTKAAFDDVIRGWNCLRKHDVDVNILCTIHVANADESGEHVEAYEALMHIALSKQ
jgi:sulfatase maturation enzyme AslB (radical SAM superfamily)